MKRTTLEWMKAAKNAAGTISSASTELKNRALYAMADSLLAATEEILAANETDVANARGRISPVMVDRLALNPQRIEAMANGIREVAALPDPAWKVLSSVSRENGLRIEKTAVPLGVIAIIYESRPNVTSDAAALCLKSGNACILRSGRDACGSAAAIVKAMRRPLAELGLNEDIIVLVSDSSRESSYELMRGEGFIDLLIPRGGKNLIRACTENAKVPCIETGTGICHIFVDETADIDQALRIVENAKTSRPSVCNAAEVCLVHEKIAAEFLPALKKRLTDERIDAGLVPVELRLDEKASKYVDGTPAGEQDFDTEFLDYIMSVRCVSSVEEAIAHISAHSTHHSEAILSRNDENCEKFVRAIDSAAVYVNASTRFTDGGEFGLGCEMGISTQKLHARGPMGLAELCTYKYIVRGNGQIR